MPRSSTTTTISLSILFPVAFLMVCGPGVWLVNRPILIGGFPLIYLWAIGWFAVLAILMAIAYKFVWTVTDDE